MVAEVEKSPAKERRDPVPISIATRLKIKHLYLFRDLPAAQIAKEVKLPVQAVYDFVSREGLVAQKKQRNLELSKKADAREDQAQTVIVEAIATQSEEIALSGLERARDAVTRKGKDAAKNFQSWTGGIRNLVSAIKTIRGGAAIGADGSKLEMNLFFMQAPKIDPKQVQPIEVKPVTE